MYVATTLGPPQHVLSTPRNQRHEALSSVHFVPGMCVFAFNFATRAPRVSRQLASTIHYVSTAQRTARSTLHAMPVPDIA
eukprot:2280941-Rhodomonas_salina.1